MPRRDFAAPAATLAPDNDPIEFSFAGQVFRCAPIVDRAMLAGVAAGLLNVPDPAWADFDDASLRYIGNVIDFIRAVVDEPGRFVATIARHTIDDDTLADIFGYLAEEYGKRLGPLSSAANVPPAPVPFAKPRTTLDELSGILNSPKAGNRAIGEIG